MTGSPSLTDPAFHAWLVTAVKNEGYDWPWIRRNLPQLEQTYRESGGMPLRAWPEQRDKVRDRYEEL